MSELSNPTFELIHSLSGNEKRHFVIYSSRHTEAEKNIGLMLYQDLEKEKEWIKHEFLQKYRSQPYIKHFRFHKHRLFKEVLKSLHIFQRGSSVKEKLREELHHASLLAEKGMFKACIKLIREAKKTAEEYQLTVLLYEFIKLEAELARETNFAGISPSDLKKIHEEMDRVLDIIRQQQVKENSNAEVFIDVSRDGLIREAAVRSKYLKRLRGTESQKESELDSFQSKFLNYQSHLFITTVSGDFKEAAVWCGKLLDLFDRSAHMKREMMRAYMIVLHNRIIIINNLKVYEELDKPFAALATLHPTSPQLKNRLFYSSNNLLLTTLNDVGEFDQSYRLLQQMQTRLKKGEVSWLNRQHETTHWYSASISCFGVEKWKEANGFMQRILNAGDLSHRSDLLFLCHILEIFLQIESGKKDLVEYSVRSARRFLESRKRVYLFEDTVLEFINEHVPEMNSEKEKKRGYKILYNQLLPLAEKKSEKAVFETFDFLSWLEARISGESFGEVLRKKATQHKWGSPLRDRLLTAK